MTTPRASGEAPRRTRFVHLGDRLLAIGRIRSGVASIDLIAQEYGVEREDVLGWIDAHAGDRFTTLDELRPFGSPEMRGLAQRARHLANLVAEADRLIRDLHQEYVLGLATSREHLQLTKKFE